MNRPLRVLFLSYYCPPAGGPGVHRMEMLLRHCPADVRFTVISATVADYTSLSPLSTSLDTSRHVPDSVVHRVSSGLPHSVFHALAKARLYGAVRWLYIPDVGRKWGRAACALAARLHRDEPFDLVLSTAPPFSVAVAGRACARSLSLPWVSDLRDVWSRCILSAWPSAIHWRYEAALEWKVLRDASTTVMVTPGSRSLILRQHPALDPERIACVTNGYSPSDFTPAPQSTEKFVIAHTGVFNGNPSPDGRLRLFVQGRSFHPRELDRTSHSPALLLRAMEILRDPCIEFRQIGPTGGEIANSFQRSAVAGQLRVLGIRDRREALDELMRSDAAFLCLTSIKDEARNELVPLKTYEYLGARKPVFAPIQEGDARDFLTQAGTGICTPPGDAPALAEALKSLIRAKCAGSPAVVPQEHFLRKFEWAGLAEQMAGILDRAATSAKAPRLQ
jgi:glycosyltransferase involved in cell wall biosynthesis